MKPIPVKQNVFAVILAGGSGARLWPVSRQLMPKQFIGMYSGKSPLEATINRIKPKIGPENIIAVTNRDHAFGSGYHQLKPYKTIVEPEGRNTAPAIGLAAAYISKLARDPVLVVMPADHIINREEEYLKILDSAVEEALKGKIVTLGIRPTRAETGYGYIKASGRGNSARPLPVEKFVEKPDKQTAEFYLRSRQYFWNSGIFVFKASAILEEIKQYMPPLHQLLELIAKRAIHGGGIDYAKLKPLFRKAPSVSIDYGIMEKSQRVVVIPCDIGWSDVGDWLAFYEISQKDAGNNACIGDTIAKDCKNSLLYSSGRLVAGIGLKHLAIIETADTVLACDLAKTQDVKHIVQALKDLKRTQTKEHLTVRKPWGSYTQLEENHRHKVKNLTIDPEQKISLQTHKHRAEHWVVVEGVAEVIKNGVKIILDKNESIDIPAGAKHSLINPAKLPLQIIEVQTGDYLGEDDIIRYEDMYGRLVKTKRKRKQKS